MVKTASAASAQEFFSLLEKSGLLEEQSLEEARGLVDSSGDGRVLARELASRSLLTRWQAGQLLNGFYQLNLGKYRLLDQIGVGRIGREFLAEHLQLGRRVAIKLVSRTLTAESSRLKQFLAESRRVAALDHPGLVHSYDVDQEGQRWYVVTEFVEGEDLKQRVKRAGPCSLASTVEYLIQAAQGLAHAASSGVAHGDLKPSNLLLDKQGVLKVADLGFARLVDGATNGASVNDSQERNLNDGIEFSAPEALNRVEGDLDWRADVFSLGQTMFYLLTGELPPAPADSAADRAKAFRDAMPSISNHTAEFYAQLTAPTAGDRPTSWEDVLKALRSLPAEKEEPAAAPPSETPVPAKKKALVAKAIAAADSTDLEVVAMLDDSAEVQIPKEEDEIAATEDQPFAFVVNHGARRNGPKPAAKSTEADAPAKATATSDATAEAPSPRRGNKQIDKRMLIGIGAGVGLLVLLLIVTLIGTLGGWGASKEVARTAEKPALDKESSVADEEEAMEGEESVEEPASKSAEAGTKDPMADAVAAVAASPEKAKADAPPAPPVNESPAGSPSPSPAEPAAKTEAPKADAPKTETDPAAPDIKLDVQPDAKPAATTPPAPTTPAPAPAPAPKPASPFEKVPTFVALHEPDNVNPVGIGEINIAGDALVQVSLYGGDLVNKGKQTFKVANAGGGVDARNWDFTLTGKGTEADLLIAKLHLEQNRLVFEWTEAAATQPLSANLWNCLLQLTSGVHTHNVALRKAEEIEPITLDLDKATTIKIPIKHSPPGEHAKVELTGLDPKMFPNLEVWFRNEKAKEPVISASNGDMVLWIGDTPEGRNLGLRVETSDKGKSFDLKIQPLFRIDQQVDRITRKSFPEANQVIQQRLVALAGQSSAVDASKLEAKQKTAAKDAIKAEETKLNETLEKLKKAYALKEKAHNNALVYVRVTLDVGVGKVVLAQSKGAPPEAPKAAPAEKK